MLRRILFTHDDMDGAGCSILWKLANRLAPEDNWDTVNCSNYNIDTKVEMFLNEGNYNDETVVCFADICVSRALLEKLSHMFKTVKIFDHHVTNLFATEIIPDAVVKPENENGKMESGTSLLYHYLYSLSNNENTDKDDDFITGTRVFNFGYNSKAVSINCLVDAIRSYDTFEFKSTGDMTPKYMQVLFSLSGFSKIDNNTAYTTVPGKYKSPLEVEFKLIPSHDLKDESDLEAMLNKKPDEIKTDLIISKNDMEFVNVKIDNEKRAIDSVTVSDVIDLEIVVNTSNKTYRAALLYKSIICNFSELAYTFLNRHKEYDLMINFNLFNCGTFEFRTIRDDLDLGNQIAAPLGGGGHPKAAGAPLISDYKEMMINAVISALNAKRI
jgi:oligoribonuclease NrnB/cAMP/cGMP phosphodiesterase (DHH superfamily)